MVCSVSRESGWVGLRRMGGGWQWVDGSSMGYKSWACCCGACMPDGSGQYVVMNFETHKFGLGHWDDTGAYQFSYGYFCEQKLPLT